MNTFIDNNNNSFYIEDNNNSSFYSEKPVRASALSLSLPPKCATARALNSIKKANRRCPLFHGTNWQITIKNCLSDATTIYNNITYCLRIRGFKMVLVFPKPMNSNNKEVDLVALIFLTDTIHSNHPNFWSFVNPDPTCIISAVPIEDYISSSTF